MKFKISRKKHFPSCFLLVFVIAILITFKVSSPELLLPRMVSVLSAVGGFAAFFYHNQTQELAIFRELFKDFNVRYDRLNGELNNIRSRPSGVSLKQEDLGVLYDYFNICGEEYFYFSAGYIDVRVWDAWREGMNYFAGDPEIRDLWELELKSGAYYGMTPLWHNK